MSDENLPASQDGAQELPALRVENLPDRRMAAETVTDVLPAVVYQNIGSLSQTLTPEQEAELDEPTPDDEVDIRPDGLVYASHEYYRRKLNHVFGRFGWTLIPGSPLKDRLDKRGGDRSEWYQRWVLLVGGIYVSEAIASRTLWENNRQMTLDDVAEAIKSDALKRCCKDLGIATECWQRRWTKEWRDKYAIQVVVQGKQGNEVQWRRADADVLSKEIGTVAHIEKQKQQRGSAQPKADAPTGGQAVTPGGPQATRPKAPESAASANGQGQAEAPKPEGRPSPGASAPSGTGAGQTSPRADGASAPPKAQGPTTPAPSAQEVPPKPTGRGPTMSQAQVNMILARSRTCGLIVEQDPTYLMELLDTRGVDLIDTEGRTKMENCIATLKQIYMKDVNQLLKAIDAAKQADEGAERI